MRQLFGRIRIFCLYALLGAVVVWATDSVAQTLFQHTRDNVLDNLKRFPRYVCVQTVTRSQYELPRTGTSCASAISSAERHAGGHTLLWHDRLRLDVAVGQNSEMYSWAGASKFESGDLRDLVSHGASGSGEFGAFVTSVFGSDGEQFVYQGGKDLPIGRVASFDYTVPVDRSHYRYAAGRGGAQTTIGYRGSFFVDPVTADLRELDVEANEFPETAPICSVEDKIEYARTKIGDDTFILPSHSTMDVIYRNSTEFVNVTSFSGCRAYVGDSSLRFDVDENANVPGSQQRAELTPLAPKTHFRIRIDPPVDSDTAAAGDPIIGVVTSAVKEKGVVLVNAGDKLKGRIVRLEQAMGQRPRWTAAILFDTLERSGIEQKVALTPDDDGERSPFERAQAHGRPVFITDRPAGGGVFYFQEFGHLVLDRKFESEWETR